MAIPKVKFDQPEPIEINAREHLPVKLKVKPRHAGKCTVKLITTADTVNFENGTKEMELEVEASSKTEEVDCVFQVKTICEVKSVLAIILRAVVINPDGKKSLTARADTRVDGKTEVTNNLTA